MSEQQTIARKKGRPRKIKSEVTGAEVEKEVPAIREVEADKVVEGKKEFIVGIRAGKDPIYPYRGNEHLVMGQNHYFVNGNPSVGYKLIRVYLGPRNRPHRSLEKTLKPKKQTPRGEVDRGILKRLKEIGVSGII